jgi:hypothetical protein
MFSEKHIKFSYENIYFQKSKIGHGGPTQNRIMRRTTVTEFSKTFLVFYKWPDLTDVQVMLAPHQVVRNLTSPALGRT